jgi:protein-tyrosine phosphatase
LFEMIRQGALAQLNAGSLLGNFGPEAQSTAFRLLQHNLVQVVASDAHSLKHRPPVLSQVYNRLKEMNPEKADLLLKDIPRAIINDKGLPDMDEPSDPEKRVKFFDFIKKRKS